MLKIEISFILSGWNFSFDFDIVSEKVSLLMKIILHQPGVNNFEYSSS